MPARPAAHTPPLDTQLLSLAVHEFRTPASVLGGYLRMLQRDTATPLADRHRQMVEEAEKSCARLVALVSELNDIARLDDPAVEMPRVAFDFFGMIRDIAAEAREAATTAVTIKVRGATSPLPFRGDEVRLHAAFGALVRATLREQDDHATLLIDCRRHGRGKSRSLLVVLAAEPELALVAAAPEARFDEMRGGLGLSLPIARRVIERHGGRVWSPPGEKGELGLRRAVLVALAGAD